MKPIDDDLLADAARYAGRWIEYRQRALDLPGLAVAIAHGDHILLEDAFGVADLRTGTPLTPQHRFRVASHSKTFTASAVLLLQERGVLRLDDPVGRWLSDLPDDVQVLTLRQLLSHGAGIIRDGLDTGFWSLEHPFPDEEQFRALIRGASAVYAPNERFKYSNFGYTVVGLVIAAAAGVPYNAFVQREVIDPLQLDSTGPEPRGAVWQQLTRGHSAGRAGRRRIVLPHANTRAMSAATGFYSTVGDLCRWGHAHVLGNPELLSDASKREMQHEQWRTGSPESGYGLGLITYDVGGRHLVGHTGGFPGFITSTMFDPEQDLVVTVLTNAGDGPAPFLAAQVVRLIDRALEASPRAGDSERFAGRFFNLGQTVDVVRLGGDLLAVNPELPAPLVEPVRLTVEGPETLKITEAPGFASPGELVHYEFDGAGRATSIRWAGSYLSADEARVEDELARLTAEVDAEEPPGRQAG